MNETGWREPCVSGPFLSQYRERVGDVMASGVPCFSVLGIVGFHP